MPSLVLMLPEACSSWSMFSLRMRSSASFRPVSPVKIKGESMNIPCTLKSRLVKDRLMTSITLRIPVDVVESMKNIAPKRGFSGYQSLLKAYLSEGLRRDEAQFAFGAQARLLEALRKHGVAQSILDEATREMESM